MLIPPHVIKAKIDAMPDGPEKERKLKNWHRQMEFCSWLLLIETVLGISLVVLIFAVAIVMMGKGA